MTISEMFTQFLEKLAINNASTISERYGEITASLNKKFRDTDSKTANSLQVGSYGRWTGIRGISDLDMLYIMPVGKWETYKNDQSKLLKDTKEAIKARYPSTKLKVDRLVVQVVYKSFMVEVQPVFENDDGSFQYPDTYGDGQWKPTKPRLEIEAMKEFVEQKNKNLRKLCKMTRAWKNKHGVGMGGLLIDTLAYNFLKSTNAYDNKSFAYYDEMCRDFFKYLSEEPDKDYYLALGSNQQVKVKKKFQKKAKKAYNLSLKAIEAGTSNSAHKKWKAIFGRPFPNASAEEAKKFQSLFSNTEQFVEDLFPIDIRFDISLECKVSQNGFRDNFLSRMLQMGTPLLPKKELHFYVNDHNIPGDYEVHWKVLNRGYEAERRNCIRGQIFPDKGHMNNRETANFVGRHIVECYAVKNGVVVAKDRIHVPIR
ncbi:MULTISPECIES: nucleotide-binding domain-containing protein [unclassified Endozoicomonas]|uniref:nucleotide-binding domain-containing protein n=1 Tax=unclassified Endozoicomonas TaxID=2644528 RepID=UPI003BB6F7C0